MNMPAHPFHSDFLNSSGDSLLLFGLVDGSRFRNGMVAEALPTAASLCCVFDEPPMVTAESRQDRTDSKRNDDEESSGSSSRPENHTKQ